jgi:hypothetical protein
MSVSAFTLVQVAKLTGSRGSVNTSIYVADKPRGRVNWRRGNRCNIGEEGNNEELGELHFERMVLIDQLNECFVVEMTIFQKIQDRYESEDSLL